MTDWKISALENEIERLTTAVSELTGAVSSADRHLDSLNDRLRDFASDFWFWAFPLLPLGFLLFLMVKHW